MCGIAGFNWDDAGLARKMADAICHRGPDDKGHYTDKGISLSHRRLSIIDLSEKGRQPMSNEDGTIWITFNGEIYNFQDLRHSLEKSGHKFRSNSDTEVIIHSYEQYGEKCVNRFNGDFAFAVWDGCKNQLFLARDRLGVKPLYYYWDGERFIFASEIKAILEHSIKREIDNDALRQFFTFRFAAYDKTLFKNIFRLMPGHTLVLSQRNLNITKYWDIVNFDKVRLSERGHINTLKSLMADSTRLRMIADVPVGVWLSGGLDSSIITALFSERQKGVKTFSVDFESESEVGYARDVAEKFGTDHKEILVTDRDLERLGDVVWHLDEPVGDPACLPVLKLSELAHKHVKVVLAGEGADELFCGYDRYKFMYCASVVRKFLPAFLGKLVTIGRGEETSERFSSALKISDERKRYLEIIRLFREDELANLGINGVSISNFYPDSVKLLDRIQYFDVKTLLPSDFFLKADKMTSAYGMEERVPFLDHRIVEFSFRLPRRMKLRGLTEKYILKKAYVNVLPREIVLRKKHGFNVPIGRWFKGPLKDMLSSLLDESRHNLYDTKYAAELLRRFQSTEETTHTRTFYDTQKLWSILVFELWHKRFFG